MSDRIRKLGRTFVRNPLKTIIGSSMEDKLNLRLDLLEQNLQNLNLQKLRSLYPSAEATNQRTIFRNNEIKVYSENGEDGLLLYIFSKIGTTNQCFVEFGIEDGRECNTANLSINFGWNGLLMDCDEKYVAKAKHYYRNRPEIKPSQVKIVQCFVTAENINKVLMDNGVEGDIDLLSIDIDGNDYWVFKAVTVINPRVVVIEYNALLGSDKPLTVEYDPNFIRYKKHPSGYYHGASLTALTKLANTKGYKLVGCVSSGTNAFFVKEKLLTESLHEVSVQDAYYPHFRRLKKGSMSQQFERVKHLKWQSV
jgi:hypothetical protein